MPMTQRLFLPLLALATALSLGCSSQDQLHRVEQEVGDLKIEVFKLRQQVEDSNRMAATEHEAAKGGREQDRRFQADLQETLRQLQNSTRALNNRLGDMRHTPPPPAAAVNAAPAQAPGAAATQPDDERAYNATQLDYNRGNYALAAEGLKLFLKHFPQSARRPDALFFLGLSYYNQHQYRQSQAAFERIIQNHAASSQFLPAKLKWGQCLLRQGLKPAAVKAFKDLVNGFPDTPEAHIAKQELSDLGL